VKGFGTSLSTSSLVIIQYSSVFQLTLALFNSALLGWPGANL